MVERLIYVNNWFPKYEVDRAEYLHYEVFNHKSNGVVSAMMATDQSRQTNQEQTPIEPKPAEPEIVGKSMIVWDVKPWDDETDINTMEKAIRTIEADGLVWGESKQIPVAFGIKKLQIVCIVEDDKIGTDFLEEKICEFDEYVQSVDIVIFHKA